MSQTLGWVLALLAVAAGYVGWGWPGVVLALTVVVFWLLLQFSAALRALRAAAGRPVGQVDNAVMLNAKLQTGLRLMQILKLTRSLGEKIADEPETFRWTDGAGDAVQVELHNGRCTRWTLQRAATPPAVAPPAA